jgi:hypothetical protein
LIVAIFKTKKTCLPFVAGANMVPDILTSSNLASKTCILQKQEKKKNMMRIILYSVVFKNCRSDFYRSIHVTAVPKSAKVLISTPDPREKRRERAHRTDMVVTNSIRPGNPLIRPRTKLDPAPALVSHTRQDTLRWNDGQRPLHSTVEILIQWIFRRLSINIKELVVQRLTQFSCLVRHTNASVPIT